MPKRSGKGEKHSVLVYNRNANDHDLDTTNCKLQFRGPKTAPRFQEFDGVIVEQGAFESFKLIDDGFGSPSFWRHECDLNELDRRSNETRSLIDAGGFLCLILTSPFIESHDGQDCRNTDLSKRLLNVPGLFRVRLMQRVTGIRAIRSELAEFLRHYGGAWTHFDLPPGKSHVKPLAMFHEAPVGLVIGTSTFAVPALPHSSDADSDYFSTLADGVALLWERLKQDIPDWAKGYVLPRENDLVEHKNRINDELSVIQSELAEYEELKRILVLQDEPLVHAAMNVFTKGLGLEILRKEAFKEDLSIVDTSGNLIALVEVKGVSKGVKREHVNQADSHRERSDLPADFPSLLLVNTFTNGASSLVDKGRAVEREQVEHAARNHILIIRTLDLLNLASLRMSGKISTDEVLSALTTNCGWLEVTADGISVHGAKE